MVLLKGVIPYINVGGLLGSSPTHHLSAGLSLKEIMLLF